jgi:general secretion pathway protein G
MLLNISRNRRHFGFTLVEVLIAVSLVGVLAAIAIPKYNNYRDRMDQSKAITGIRILQTLITDYFASGGTYPASLADVGNANLLDPWGRPYVYVDLTSVQGNGMARKDHKFNPINSDYDLYSTGKNGVSKTQLTQKDRLDDIVRGRDGQFVGLAGDFSP